MVPFSFVFVPSWNKNDSGNVTEWFCGRPGNSVLSVMEIVSCNVTDSWFVIDSDNDFVALV